MSSRNFKSWIAIGALVFTTARAWAVPAQGHEIMLAGPSPAAVDVARAIHLKGGNVVDVAVAAALSLAVTHPYYASFGGGGFAMVKQGKDIKALDFREMAPAKATPDLFKARAADASRHGGLAVGIPGVAAGLWELHHKYGKLKWAQLFEPILPLAEKGFRVSGEWVANTGRASERMNEAGKKIFGVGKKPGDLFAQPGLLGFLRAYRKHGASAFYEGPVAQEIVDTVDSAGGLFTIEDMKKYQPRWLDPIDAEFGGYKLHLMPPPSSGGVLIAEAVRLMEKLKLSQTKPLSVDELHMLAEIMKLAYRGRSYLGDPAFAQNPIKQLLSDKYLSGLAAKFRPDKSIDVGPLEDIDFEKESTTHFSVMDAQGNAIAMTITLNGDYGSGLVSPKSGIALNNEIDDFTTKPGQPNMFGLIQGANNLVRAGARPLSSMSPTIVEKDGRTVLAVGAPGGPRITTAVLQVLYRSLTQNMNIDQAVQAPRVHHQFLPDILWVDPLRLPPETIAALEARGHKIQTGSTGKAAAVMLDENGILNGAADARGEAAAGGL